MQSVASWGRLTDLPHDVTYLNDLNNVPNVLSTKQPGLAFGMGRSYGDVCLNPGGILWNTTTLDRFIHFNDKTGILECESGVLLSSISKLLIPSGWNLPVTPGTQFITIGGAIANDIHGKNHHKHGTFGEHVLSLTLVRTNGEIIECGPQRRPEWFAATIGGVGLTGVIIKATLQLIKIPGPYLQTETIPFFNLNEFIELADTSESSWEHTIAWIDGSSKKYHRGLFMRAQPTTDTVDMPRSKYKLSIPFTPPFSCMNRLTYRPFNTAYFNLKKRHTRCITHHESVLYPLDHIHHWNRLYGPKGFFQYQSVVPKDASLYATQAMLDAIVQSGNSSFLSTIKTFSKYRSVGMMSFPMPGVTLALDIPNRGVKTIKLLQRLDKIVLESGGRIYLAKDARMPRDVFKAGYPRLDEFLTYRDPGIHSALSQRLIEMTTSVL